MVSIVGYTVGEYVFWMIGTYLLLLLSFLARLMEDVVDEKPMWLSVILFACFGAICYFVYSLSVRIGIVAFINGLYFMYFVLTMMKVMRSWNE